MIEKGFKLFGVGMSSKVRDKKSVKGFAPNFFGLNLI